MVSGPPGAGKSTVARLLADGFPRSALVRGDDFFAFVAAGWVEPWLPEAHEQNTVVIEAAAAAAGRLAAGGYQVVYDGVLGPWLLPAFATATGLDHVSYLVLLPPEEECLARVAGRTGHGFTDPDDYVSWDYASGYADGVAALAEREEPSGRHGTAGRHARED